MHLPRGHAAPDGESLPTMPGERAGLVWRFRERELERKALISKPCSQITHQPGLSRPDMRAAADVKDQAIGRIQRNHGRIAITIIRNVCQQARVGGWIERRCHQIRHARPRIRQWHAGANAKRQRGFIHRHDPHRPALLFDKSQRGWGQRG